MIIRGGSKKAKLPNDDTDSSHQGEPAANNPSTFTNSLGMEFVLVPKGKSWLGGGGGKPGNKEVEIVNDFYLGKYEVTQEEWQKVMEYNPSDFSRSGPAKGAVKQIPDVELKRFPVEMVSWHDAQLFLKLLNAQAKEPGWVYRLPKEMEWEYACRGGSADDKADTAFDYYLEKPSNQLLSSQANIGNGKGPNRPCKVGSYKPNRLGLYDMHGNVWEWCDDELITGSSRRVDRGGGWINEAGLRAAEKNTEPPSFRCHHLGTRVARVPLSMKDKPSVAGAAQSLPKTDGLAIPGIIDCHERAFPFGVMNGFDIERSWVLSFHVWFPDLDAGHGKWIFFWGDDRNACDPIYIDHHGRQLTAQIFNCYENQRYVLVADLDPACVRTWKSLKFCFLSESNVLELYVEEKLLKKEVTTVLPRVDRPMPVWLGGTSATTGRFRGKVKDLFLYNP